MTFAEVLAQVRDLLQSKGRVSYRALKLQFDLDDDYLAGLKDELVEAEQVAVDEGGKVLVWTSKGSEEESGNRRIGESEQISLESRVQSLASRQEVAERRQLTVMFCDLVGSTALSDQLDPEELRQVIRAYQQVCAEVIGRYEGHIAQYLGDGLLVYFGYPFAHENDAQRAVRTGLEIIQALQTWVPSPLVGEGQGEGAKGRVLQVRIGIHTGHVVVGEMGGGAKREQLALGDTPNIAARVQGIAEPNTVVISAATQRLVVGFFECQDLGPQRLKNVSTPLTLYQVVQESEVQSRFEVAVRIGLTPLVGREYEVGLLRERWEKAKAGDGQVVLLSGEPGIGKSRLAQVLKDHVEQEGAIRIEFRCSPYHQNSAFYPIIDHLQRLLRFHREETFQAKLAKLQRTLATYCFPQADTLPLLAALLSLPHPEGTSPITLSPQKQKQKTQEALVAWMIEEAERQAVYCAWEDLHWADPSTLELLSPLLDQMPTARLLVLLTFRPEFTPPWAVRSYLSHLALSRLAHTQIEEMVENVTGGKALPPETVQQIVAKTDGVPLFVEELTKTVLESIESVESMGSVGVPSRAPIQLLAIPATLHDSLMARLDRLGTAKEIAQVGAVLGREFSYELIHTVFPLEEGTLQQGLRQLIDAELIYQHGLPPQATYLFKHALIQDTAYQSLLKGTRQHLHQQIAQVLEERFPETVETQPELLAHHYTEAGLIARAIPCWQRAGERATQRSANVEAVKHLTRGLEVLQTLPDTPERAQQELTLQIALGSPLQAIEGYGAPEVEAVYTRARELCQRIGETSQLFPVLRGLYVFYLLRGELRTAHELGQRLLSLAQSVQDPAFLLEAHFALGQTLLFRGEFVAAREHLEHGIALFDPVRHRSHAFLYGQDPGVFCRVLAAWDLWLLGYPDQAPKRSQEALTVAQETIHPLSLAAAQAFFALTHQFRREGQATQEHAEIAIKLSTEQGFPFFLAFGTFVRGWALAEQGQKEEGIAQARRGLTAYRTTGAALGGTRFITLLAEECEKVGQVEEGLGMLAEALEVVDKTGERVHEAELYRLYGELSLRIGEAETGRTGDKKPFSDSPFLRFSVSSPEESFQKAIEIARRQQAKSPELRAVMSLARLWQQQGRREEARQMLAEIYNWFTEGFDTKDLQEAKALLEELS